MLAACACRRIRCDLTRIVDRERIGDREARAGGYQRVEVNQVAALNDEGHVLSGLKGMTENVVARGPAKHKEQGGQPGISRSFPLRPWESWREEQGE